VRFNQTSTIVHKRDGVENMRALLLAVAMSGLVAGVAWAGSSATLQGVSSMDRPIVLDGRVWRCGGAQCAAAGRGRSQGLIRECARVARKLGPLTAYERDGVALDQAGLDRCNHEARVR
jgi:hypothetical protein